MHIFSYRFNLGRWKNRSDDENGGLYLTSKEDFYATCSGILGIAHEYQEPVRRRTRWNNRFLGNGRFPGFGLVQCFSENCVRVVSKDGTKVFHKFEDVYTYLEMIGKQN